MQVVRIYAGDDGESHFQDLTLDQFADIAAAGARGDIILVRMPSPTNGDYHNPPRRLCIVHLDGTAEFETSDGDKRRLEPGDVVISEDLTGRGHKTRNLGEGLKVNLAIPLAG